MCQIYRPRGQLRQLDPLAGEPGVSDFKNNVQSALRSALGCFGQFEKSRYSFFVNVFSLQGANSTPANTPATVPVPLLADSLPHFQPADEQNCGGNHTNPLQYIPTPAAILVPA
jgi:hypothetical protein